MRSTEIELRLVLNVEADRVTINGLVAELEQLERELFAALVDGLQREQLAAVRRGEAPPIRCPHCGTERWVKRGTRDRQLKTSRGRLQFPLRQVTCKGCERTWSPFPERLDLAPYQRTSEELRAKTAGLATEVSYAKASRWGEETMGTTLAPMTIWRTVQARGPEVEFTAPAGQARCLELDGTRVPAGRKERGAALNLAFAVGDRWRRYGRWRRKKRLVGMAVGAGSWPDGA